MQRRERRKRRAQHPKHFGSMALSTVQLINIYYVAHNENRMETKPPKMSTNFY